MDNLPPIPSLIAFDAVYRTGSMTKAAALLGRPHGVINKQLDQLHDHAGVTFFEKSGAGLKLTAEGQAFAQVVADSLDNLRKAYQTLCGDDGSKRITLQVCSACALPWAADMVKRFNSDHPNIEIHIQTVANGADPKKADLIVSWDRLTRPEAVCSDAISLGDVHIGPVLSPDYAHVFQGNILTSATRISRKGAEQAWSAWSDKSGIVMNSDNEAVFDHSVSLLAEAEEAKGVALAPKFLIERELKEASLIAPAGFIVVREGLLVLPSPDRPRPSDHVIVFLDWLEIHGRLGDDGFMAEITEQPMWG